MKNRNIKGDSVISLPLIIVFGVFSILVFTVFIINTISTYIWYEKLQSVSLKYIYIIEEYGYLTNKEKEQLISELERSGFDKNNITINFTDKETEYGFPVYLEIIYNYQYNIINAGIGWNSSKKTNIPMRIYKTTYSKK